jgi:hypothetical protein
MQIDIHCFLISGVDETSQLHAPSYKRVHREEQADSALSGIRTRVIPAPSVSADRYSG